MIIKRKKLTKLDDNGKTISKIKSESKTGPGYSSSSYTSQSQTIDIK